MAATAITSGRVTLKNPHLPHIAQAIPAFIYGTAWKKDTTADLVYQALEAGFTAVDTANQPKHYQEHLVGSGIRRALQEGKVKRDSLYVQTKFTSVGGQDPDTTPYNPKDPISEQVQDSVNLSLRNLRSAGTNFDDVEGTYIDTLVLHSPMSTIVETMEVWETMESFIPSKVRNLGISNCNLFTLMDVYERSKIKPAIVQNRFYPATKYDIGLRKFCHERSIIYQGFWTLSANPKVVSSVEVGLVADEVGISPQAALYCLVLGLDNTVVLNGTKRNERMRADLQALETVKNFSQRHPESWKGMLDGFKKLIGEPVTL